MATLREIRRRIGGVKNTQKITKAMKMVAAAKLRRAQDSMIAARPYAKAMRTMLGNLAGEVTGSAGPLFETREIRRVAVIVVTADRGLCGAFNSNVMRAAEDHLRRNYGALLAQGNVRLVAVGKKGADYFTKRGPAPAAKHVGLFSGLDFQSARQISQQVVDWYQKGTVDRVDVVYNEFKNVAQQRVMIDQFLPVPPIETQRTGSGVSPQYIYEPSGEAILADLLPKHLNFQIWRILLESNAAEQGARMTAMANATENAKEIIRDLTLSYNKARQAGITKELLEIVAGAEALRTAD
ncbi:MAG: ATP synthase F1 subunit gamma [Bacteroidetes bacterium]|nr:ATP synthase F1 subunit gamma [Bacteroidota bacterium]